MAGSVFLSTSKKGVTYHMNNTWALTKKDGEVEFVTCNYLEEAIKLIGCTINDIINIDLIDSYCARPEIKGDGYI